ncbi:Histidine kinase [Lachnospiraceae bacterium NE2001]|nr:Histidine kinase [Lachnospiraceae bacterium NE2001]
MYVIPQAAVIVLINHITTLICIVLSIVVFIVAFQVKHRSRRIRYFLSCIAICLGGLMFQIADYVTYAYVIYSLVIPMFTLYFIETERDEGQNWDGFFWMFLQTLVSVIVMMMIVYGRGGYLISAAFTAQNVVLIVMLLISSKNLVEIVGFLLATMFPIFAALSGMIYYDLRLQGSGLSMMLLIVFFGYQSDMERELLDKQVELSENKVSLLMEQIHPHFIYNALQQIALLSDEDATAVKPAILNFSQYLRKNFEALTNEKMIPFTQEMEHVDAYVKLSKILPSRNFEIEKNFELTDFRIPALTVQPLVENAIYYGIGMSEEGDVIRIETKEEGGFILVKVIDDGHGKQTELATQKKHKSVGTANVKTRLKILCDGEMSLNKSEEGTEAVIKIPYERARL